MNARTFGRRAPTYALGLVAATIFGSGCAESITASPVDPSKARAALKTTLDAWKAGGDPASLKSGSPAITAQDLDWLGGAKLVDYQVEGEGAVVASNLRIPVRLDLQRKDGKGGSRTVNYLVGTSPSVTVFRDIH